MGEGPHGWGGESSSVLPVSRSFFSRQFFSPLCGQVLDA